jgi:hypothetical protein
MHKCVVFVSRKTGGVSHRISREWLISRYCGSNNKMEKPAIPISEISFPNPFCGHKHNGQTPRKRAIQFILLFYKSSEKDNRGVRIRMDVGLRINTVGEPCKGGMETERTD